MTLLWLRVAVLLYGVAALAVLPAALYNRPRWRHVAMPAALGGVFFHFVIEGLNGDAADKDGAVTVAGLGEYLGRKVRDYVRAESGVQQKPDVAGRTDDKTVLVKLGKLSGNSLKSRKLTKKKKEHKKMPARLTNKDTSGDVGASIEDFEPLWFQKNTDPLRHMIVDL